ncbi:hypothetical protein CL621_01700 [archaeon]|nr:hypothetical protein [archaeon]
MKNAQLFSQPFNYIFILIVAALILFFGFYVVRNVLDLGSNVEFVSFKDNLQKEVSNYFYLTKGSMKSLSLRIPKEINFVCFVDLSYGPNMGFPTEYAEALIKSKRNYNTFFIPYPNKKALEPAYMNISHMRPEDPLLCVKTINKLEVKLENMGDYVLIKHEESPI